MGEGFSRAGFKHEFAHNLYASPHNNGANGVKGTRYYNNFGWGMMASGDEQVNQSANAWERWYNGWIELKTGATQINSDIQSASDLNTTGEYTLRDFATYGDVVRIKIPYTNQFLWLENHTGATIYDNRSDFNASRNGVAYLPPPRGILAFVETIGGRESASFWNNTQEPETAKGIKVVAGNGSYDYSPLPDPLDNYNFHFTHFLHYNFSRIQNPTSGENEISGVVINRNGDNILNYGYVHGNEGYKPGFEGDPLVKLDGGFADGFVVPNIAINPGHKMGLSHNPMIIPHQRFDILANKLSSINFHSLSVEIISKFGCKQ